MRFIDEIREKLLGDLEIGNDAVRKGPYSANMRRRLPEHHLRFFPDGDDLPRLVIDRDNRRFRDHDAAAAHIDERIRRPEVDTDIASEKRGGGESGHTGLEPGSVDR